MSHFRHDEMSSTPTETPTSTSLTTLTLPTITLPAAITPHLRALIYASSRGNLITPLTLTPCLTASPSHSQNKTLVISLTHAQPKLPLYHPPPPNIPAKNIFLSHFPLTVSLKDDVLTFNAVLPKVVFTLPAEGILPSDAVTSSATVLLLRTGTSSHTHGLLTLHNGRYDPLPASSKPTGEVVGAWSIAHDVSVTTALLFLGRYLFRRRNRRLGGGHAVRKHVVLLRFCGGDVQIRRGCVAVEGTQRWTCVVPVKGGVGQFRPVRDGRERRERREVETRKELDDGAMPVRDVPRRERASDKEGNSGNMPVRDVPRTRSRETVEPDEEQVQDSGQEEGGEEEEEIMVAKMREFQFDELPTMDGFAEEHETEEERETEEEPEILGAVHIADDLRGVDIDMDTFCEGRYSSESSSEDDQEDRMLETLCRQYLNHGWEEGVSRELARLS